MFQGRLFLLVLLVQSIAFGNDDKLVLLDQSCSMIGVPVGKKKVEANKSDLVMSICDEIKNKLQCDNYQVSNQSKISSTIYSMIELEKGQFLLSNEAGNIKMFLNTKKKEYRYGQVTALPDYGVIVSKNCYGIAGSAKDFKKELSGK